MDTKAATTQIRIQQWAEIIQDRSASGLTVDDYCESHGLQKSVLLLASKGQIQNSRISSSTCGTENT